ncbi:MAG: histidine phosphotransferase family protein [Pseudomonadota bacterium]
MSDTANTAILEMLASRICHDIISPVGAVNNGVEFMEEMGPDAGDEALKLISYSASQAAAKLQAFRMAYGAGGKDPNIKPEDVQKAFSALISAEGKISQTWDPFGPLGPDPLPLGFCKILLCTMMLAMEALPKGGSISVKAGENNDTLVIAEGENAGLRDQTEDALMNKIAIDELDPRLVHPYVIGMIAELYNFSIKVLETDENKVTFAFHSLAGD